MSHTPGPWISTLSVSGSKLPPRWLVCTTVAGDRPHPVVADCGIGDTPEQHANAVLMAAAPDLLAACEAALDLLRDVHPEACPRGNHRAVANQLNRALVEALRNPPAL